MNAQEPLQTDFEYKLLIHGPDFEQVFDVPVGSTILGRQPGCDLVLPDPQVSRRHAQIDCQRTPDGLECFLNDLGSSNGTWVNGEKLAPRAPVTLEPGAQIKIGVFTLTLEGIPLAAQPEPAPPPVEKAKPHPPPPKRKVERVGLKVAPPGEGAPPPPPIDEAEPEGEHVPPGLSIHSRRLLNYLPGIYHSDFMARFLGIFEAILAPLEWNIDNFDLFLDPGTAMRDFLPWLENWFYPPVGVSWSEAQRRQLLEDAHMIYARRGTRWALSRVLEIYLGRTPTIIDDAEDLEPHTFQIEIPLRRREVDPDALEAIIDASKPAHTTYQIAYLK